MPHGCVVVLAVFAPKCCGSGAPVVPRDCSQNWQHACPLRARASPKLRPAPPVLDLATEERAELVVVETCARREDLERRRRVGPRPASRWPDVVAQSSELGCGDLLHRVPAYASPCVSPSALYCLHQF